MLYPELGFELTFIPNRPGRWGKEYRCKEEAAAAARALNQALDVDSRVADLAARLHLDVLQRPLFRAKADTFRAAWLGQTHDSWCVEVGNYPLESTYIISGSCTYNLALQAVYEHAAKLGLHPHIEQTKRDGTVRDYPTGGGHIHLSTRLWPHGDQCLLRLYMLEKALCVAYANRPYLRWLFAQWSDDANSEVAVTGSTVGQIWKLARTKRFSKGKLTRWAHNEALLCRSIQQRFADCQNGKPTYGSWELRWFDMPRSVEELRLQVSFVTHWAMHYGERLDALWTAKGGDYKRLSRSWEQDTSFALTSGYYRKLTKDLGFARAEVEGYLRTIGLDPDPIMTAFWERGFVRRFRYGKMI